MAARGYAAWASNRLEFPRNNYSGSDFFPKDDVPSGIEGVEIKTTRKTGGAVDTHGARDQWMCVFVYSVDNETEPAVQRRPLTFTEIYLGHVGIGDFRKNARGELGTRTATLHAEGIAKLRRNWIYMERQPETHIDSGPVLMAADPEAKPSKCRRRT